jgi:hypothetical protein
MNLVQLIAVTSATAVLALSVGAAGAAAAPAVAKSVHAVIKDWEVACDNTRACEAAGFQSDESESAPVSLWLGRPAGPHGARAAKLSASTLNESAVGPLTLQVGRLTLRGLTSETALTPAQIAQLLPALLDANAAAVSDGKNKWQLSLAGMKAALLKMDDLQGRVDTVTALVKRGPKPASAVLAPVPAPTLQRLPLQRLPSPLPLKQDEALLPKIMKTLKNGGCDEAPDLMGPESQSEINRLSASQVVLLIECGRGAYQSSFAVWIANDKPPYAAKRAPLVGADGKPERELLNAGFDKGELGSFAKGRGLGDCNVQASWVWTAAGFKLASASSAQLCRGVPGGHMLSDWSAQVR